MQRRDDCTCWRWRSRSSDLRLVGARWVSFFSVLSIFMLGGQCAAGAVELAQFKFPQGTRHESLGEDMRLYGRPVQIRVFDAPLGVPELIKVLSDEQPALVDLRILPGQAILSGIVGESLWIVQMEGLGERSSAGSISVMSARAAWTPATSLPAWMPQGGRLRFDFSVREGAQRVTEEIWTHTLPPGQLQPLIRRNLATHGWTTHSTANELGLWTRKGQGLRLDIYAVDGGGSGVRAQRVLP